MVGRLPAPNLHRTVVDRFAVQDGVFLELTALRNKLLPTFPLSESAEPTATDQAAVPPPAAATSATPPAAASANADAIIPDASNVSDVVKPLSQTKPTRKIVKPDMYKPAWTRPTAACAVCLTDCNELVCVTCDDAALLVSDSPLKVSPTVPTPSMTSILNLYGGSYSSDTNISAECRRRTRGVIDLDNDATDGGGAAADITANSVFSFTIAIVEAGIIAGVISAQRCSGGSVVRLREGQGDDTKPLMVISQTYPHGVP